MLRALPLIVAFAVLPTASSADCICRAKNVVASQGEVVCLAMPDGDRMARCDKVLNNASWTFLEVPCPAPALSVLSPAAPVPERIAAAAPQSPLR